MRPRVRLACILYCTILRSKAVCASELARNNRPSFERSAHVRPRFSRFHSPFDLISIWSRRTGRRAHVGFSKNVLSVIGKKLDYSPTIDFKNSTTESTGCKSSLISISLILKNFAIKRILAHKVCFATFEIIEFDNGFNGANRVSFSLRREKNRSSATRRFKQQNPLHRVFARVTMHFWKS